MDGQQQREQADTAPLLAGATIGHYLLLDTLSTSATSVVHLAHDLALERTVVVKSGPGAPEAVEQRRREARALSRIHSPHVVLIHGAIDTPDGPALVLEHLSGTTLAQRLKTHGPLPPREAIDLFAQLLSGLEDLHRAQVVHGHLKPANIFLGSDGVAKLVDLRLATLLDQHAAPQARLGDLLYGAPEQINGHRPDPRADIYSLGLCLHEALTGTLPFHDAAGSKVGAPLDRIVARALAQEPEHRYASAREFRAALTASTPSTPREPGRAPRWARTLAIDTALLATLMGLAWMLGLVPYKLHTNEVLNATVNAAHARPPAASARRPVPVPHDRYRDLRQAWGG